MNETTIWIGERRLGWMTVSGGLDVPGFGLLPECRVKDGDIVRGSRARLFRDGVLIAEDLHVGALIREKSFVGNRLEALEAVGASGRCAVASGCGDVREGDRFEVYMRARTTDGRLMPGYQATGVERRLGSAEVRGVDGDPLVGPAARVGPIEGTLTAGDRVRVVRGGEPVAEALRLLFVTDTAGQVVDELRAHSGSLYLGFSDLRPGDAVVAYDVPAPVWTEARSAELFVHQMRSDGVVAHAMVDPGERYRKKRMSKDGLAVGHRARIVRERTVIADGVTIGYLPDEGTFGGFLRTGPGGGVTGSFELGLDFPDLRTADRIEPYQILDLRGGRYRD
ncbi:hypothetical protein E1293_38615 [Actinomadura darangshiensis]|uniref:Uncharacterized protein n=1 Tax=Actinomadura darangshiensis TaxID=705336 RepID=A0A4R5A8F5_9ACTN|nr:hypothetical protein [Actinomadura darangshiensis]TDD66944.1 hypothetical protein E1293_38615 [Actinomadura darangshiensis]